MRPRLTPCVRAGICFFFFNVSFLTTTSKKSQLLILCISGQLFETTKKCMSRRSISLTDITEILLCSSYFFPTLADGVALSWHFVIKEHIWYTSFSIKISVYLVAEFTKVLWNYIAQNTDIYRQCKLNRHNQWCQCAQAGRRVKVSPSSENLSARACLQMSLHQQWFYLIAL